MAYIENYSDKPKMSSAYFVSDAKGARAYGWLKSKSKGMVKFSAIPSKKYKTKKEHVHKWLVRVSSDRIPTPWLTNGFYDTKTKTLRMPELFGGMVAGFKPSARRTKSGKPTNGSWTRLSKR